MRSLFEQIQSIENVVAGIVEKSLDKNMQDIEGIIGGLNSMSMISLQIIMYSPDDVLQKLNISIN